MKLQLGVLHRDGRPATPEDVATLVGPWGARSAETAGELLDGPLAMAYRGDRLTWEDDAERQPLDCGPFVLTWDGRLDNREDLARRLGLRGLRAIPDASLVAQAYATCGESIVATLIGEFALVLWTKATRSLLFARSVCGARPLYYVANRDAIWWSSDFAHLVCAAGVDLAVNDSYVLEYLVSQPGTHHTPLRAVKVIPPGTLVRFETAECHAPRPLWDPTAIPGVTYRTAAEYEEHCRDKLTEAVRVRLRAKHPVFAELSGGLDSSSVVLTADRILEAPTHSPATLRTVSCVYEESQTCDEYSFIRAVEQVRGTPSLLVHETEQGITLGLTEITFSGLPSPLHCFPGRYLRFTALMEQHGARVLLTGNGGDHLFWSDVDGAPLVADELCTGHLRRLHRSCLLWSRRTRVPYLRLLLKMAVPLTLDHLAPGWFPYAPAPLPAWIGPRYRKQGAAMLWGGTPPTGAVGPPSQRIKLKLLANLIGQISAGYFSDYRHISLTHPYTHRPLIEFCLGVPIAQLVLDGEPRSLMRRALRDLLPAKVAKRRSKGILEEAIGRAVQRDWSVVGDLRRWQLCQRELVQPRQLSESLHKARLGIQLTNEHVLRVFSMERWLRSLESLRGRSPALQSAVGYRDLMVEVPAAVH